MHLILTLFSIFDISAFHKMKTECFVHKRYPRFITYAESLLQNYPDQDAIWIGLIEANHYLDNESKVLKTIKKYLKQKKNQENFKKVMMLLAGSRRRRGMRINLVPKITEYYRDLINDQRFYSWELSGYYLSKQNYPEVIAELIKAIDREPNRLSAGWKRFQSLFRRADSSALIKELKDSRYPKGRDLLLAMVAFHEKRYNDAVYYFQKYSYTDGLIEISEILASRNQLDEALRIIRKVKGVDDQKIAGLFFKAGDYLSALDLSKDPHMRAECLIHLGRYQEAIKGLDNLKGYDARRLKCYALIGLGKLDQALDLLKGDGLPIGLDLLKAKVYLARLNTKIGYEILIRIGNKTQSDLANDALEWRLICEKTNFDTITIGHYARADLFYGIGKVAEAGDELKVIKENSPIFDYAVLLLAQIYQDQGEFEWARLGLDKIRKSRSDSPIMPKILYLEIDILEKMGKRGEAESLTDSLLLHYPTSPEAEAIRE